MSTIKTLVVVAVKKHWSMFQLDLVCKLQKSLYGLRQASRQWYANLSQAMSSRGYQHSLNDYSLFTKVSGDSIVVLAVYVDDIILTETDSAEILALKSFLHQQFRIQDLGSLSYFLGIEVFYSVSGVLLHQKKFLHDLLIEFHYSDVTPVVCPLPQSVKLTAKEGVPLPTPEVNSSLVGKLNFITHTRPDISFDVQHLSQFMQSPCVPHLEAALHFLKYLKGTAEFGIFLNNTPDFSVAAFCDSDWAACPDTRRSI
uniref:Uncharacterized mitochondrial protein AtMg00810-like n=1 Tax=Nicotiana tabacum TaxID=4097 RepID=A0A1S4BWG1_TOBAC|nr:PREDICTED: uncharacterized mitochondrial protein AtMg00810-like [Nicotiana tabacum]